MSRLVALIALVASVGVASAHHGFTGRYDASRPLWVEGEVVSAHIGPPHIEVRVRTPERFAAPVRQGVAELDSTLRPLTPAPPLSVREDHRNTTVLLEFPPIINFTGLRGNLRPGDRVAAVVYRNCDRPHNLRVQWFRAGDGRVLPGRRNVQTEVERC